MRWLIAGLGARREEEEERGGGGDEDRLPGFAGRGEEVPSKFHVLTNYFNDVIQRGKMGPFALGRKGFGPLTGSAKPLMNGTGGSLLTSSTKTAKQPGIVGGAANPMGGLAGPSGVGSKIMTTGDKTPSKKKTGSGALGSSAPKKSDNSIGGAGSKPPTSSGTGTVMPSTGGKQQYSSSKQKPAGSSLGPTEFPKRHSVLVTTSS